jgi:hypothetical protein
MENSTDNLDIFKLHPHLEKILRKTYNILGIVNLSDQSPEWGLESFAINKLYSLLAPLTKKTYDINDRIIIMHFDTDYYIDPLDNSHPGLMITYVQQMCSALNIPNYFILMITNHDNIEKELTYLQKKYSVDDIPIPYINCELVMYAINSSAAQPVNLNQELICKKYSCLNYNSRPHRDRLMSLLTVNNLLDEGLVSYSAVNSVNVETKKDLFESFDIPNSINKHYLGILPSLAESENQRCDFRLIDKITNNIKPNNMELDGLANSLSTWWQYLDLQKSFLYVGTETLFQFPRPLLTEKSYRGITAKRPFVILGPQHILKKLKSLGFKTFNEFWDEGYDDIIDPSEKILAIFKIIDDICKLSLNELSILLTDMSTILDYNFQHYLNLETELLIKFQKDITNLKR